MNPDESPEQPLVAPLPTPLASRLPLLALVGVLIAASLRLITLLRIIKRR